MPPELRGYPQVYEELWKTLKICDIDHERQFGQMTN